MGGTWKNVVKCIEACEQRKVGGSGGPLLPLDLMRHIISFLDHNTQALTGRLISKRLSKSCRKVVQFGKPLPQFDGVKPTKEQQASAEAWKKSWQGPWQPYLQLFLKQLTFRDKFLVLSAAASSGSKLNLELAWGLLRPCLFPELLRRARAHASCYYLPSPDSNSYDTDAGAAAIAAGHLRLLPWLLQQRCPLDPAKILQAAAAHSDLAGLQTVWKLLGYDAHPPQDATSWPGLLCKVANTIGRSADAPAEKFSWLLEAVDDEVLQEHWDALGEAAAEGAAAAGNLPLLQWLCDDGLELEGNEGCTAPGEALRHGHVAVADWLVREAGCPLPMFPEEEEGWLQDVWGQVGGGSVEAVRWLRGHGVPVDGMALKAAAGAGRLEVAQYLHGECGVMLTAEVFAGAAGSGSVPTATWLREAGCPMDHTAYGSAAGAGNVAMVRWLAAEAGCPWNGTTTGKVIAHWRDQEGGVGDTAGSRSVSTSSASSGLGQAVRVLLLAGCPLDTSTCMEAAARRGDLPLLRYLHTERGAALYPEVLAAAVEGGCEAVLEWLVQVRPKLRHEGWWDPHLSARGDVAMLACLRRLRVPLRPCVVSWADGKDVPLPLVRWLMEQGAQWDSESVKRVLQWSTGHNRCSDTVVWLQAQLAKCKCVW